MKKIPLFLSLLLLNSCSLISSSANLSESNQSTLSSEIKEEITVDSEGYVNLPLDYFAVEDDGKEKSRISLFDYPDESLFTEYRAFVSSKKAELYKVKTDISHTFSPFDNDREDSAVLSFTMKGRCVVTIQLKNKFSNRKPTIRPLNTTSDYSIDKTYNTLSFEIFNPGQYVLEFNDYKTKTLHIFVEEEKEDLNLDGYTIFSKGIHTSDNDSRIPQNGIINLNESNKKIYLEEGAIVQAGFFAKGLTGVDIRGPGYIDGSPFVRNASTGERLIPVDFQDCTDVRIQDVTFLDPAGWCLSLYYLTNVTVDNVKIITSRANGDGISLQSCKSARVNNCFVRSYDDSIVIKNYPRYENYSNEGTTRDIKITNSLIYTDLAQSLEIGYETIGEILEDVTFENITILKNHHHAFLSLHNANNACVKNIVYKDITIEDCQNGKRDGNGLLIDVSASYSSTWSDNWKKTSVGEVSGVDFKNILCLNYKENKISIRGSLDIRDNTLHYVDSVKFRGFKMDSKLLTEEDLTVNQYVNDVSFLPYQGEIVGAKNNCKYRIDEIEEMYSKSAVFA